MTRLGLQFGGYIEPGGMSLCGTLHEEGSKGASTYQDQDQ